MKVIRFHPVISRSLLPEESDDESDEESDYEEFIAEEDVYQNSIDQFQNIEEIEMKVKESSIELQIKLPDLKTFLESFEFSAQALSLDLERLRAVTMTNELLIGLKLDFKSKTYFMDSLTTFDEALCYSSNDRQEIKRIVTTKGGYLNDESNYFCVDKQNLSTGTEVVILKNSRVLLFWRDLSLPENVVKRILSMGLLFLLRIISKAELLFNIRQILPRGDYEISINEKDKTYVLIGIEKPLFNFT